MYVETIALTRDTIVEQWAHHRELVPLFDKYNMEADYFSSHHASPVIDALLEMMTGQGSLESRALNAFVEYMRNRDVIAEDFYTIYSVLRQVVVGQLLEHFPGFPELVTEYLQLADEIYKQALVYFNRSVFSIEGSVQDQLQLAKEYQKVIDKSAIVSKTDTRGIITYVNPAFVAISGYTKEELLGHPQNVVRHPDMDKKTFERLWKTIQAKKIFQGVIKNRKRNGEEYYVDTTIVPVLNRENEIVEYIAMRYDVTKFAMAVAAAKEAKKAKEEFLSNMSHEIRTPLNAIMGFVQVLLKSVKEPKHLEKLQIVHQNSLSLLQIINDILDFSKIESGHFSISPNECDMLDELAALFELFVPKMAEKEISFPCYVDPALPDCVNVDMLRIKQIVTNLLSNAVKFTPEKGSVEVEVTYSHGRVKITVHDNGIGIPADKLDTIFSAFQQADGSISRKYGGTGLGLSISSRLATLMDGELVVKSEEGSGSKFSLIIPCEACKTSASPRSRRLRDVSVGLYYGNATESCRGQFALLKRYLGALGVTQVKYINWLEDIAQDIVVYDPHHIDAEEISLLRNSPARTIGLSTNDLMEHPFSNTVLSVPLNWQKVYKAFSDDLDITCVDTIWSKHQISGHVLVAEDNRSNQQLIEILLEEYGLEVTFANDGVEAVQAYAEGSFDLILMDNQMPNMGGVEATRRILAMEKNEERIHTPIVALTANVLESDRKHFNEVGMDAFLAKPVDTQELEKILLYYVGNDTAHDHADTENVASDPEEDYYMTLADIAQRMGIKEKHVGLLIQTFQQECAEQLDELKKGVESNDLEKIAYNAHAIKGSSGNLRFSELSDLAKASEDAAKAGDRSFDYADKLAKMGVLFEEIKSIS
jgi:PAS domain S-box-containing protein